MAEARQRSSAVVLAGLVTLTVAAPLLVGGAPAAAQIALATAGLFVGLAAVIERAHRLRLRLLLLSFGLAVLLPVLQLMPLPPALLSALSPEAAALRSEVGQTGWLPLSLDVPATVFALLRDLLLLVVFVVASSIGRSNRRSRAVLGSIVAAALIVAIAALIERAVGTKKIFGVYDFTHWPGSGIWGSFVNGNHAASLFALGALIVAGAAVELEGWRRVAPILVALSLSAMTLHTGSRGGALGLIAGGGLMAVWLMARRFGRWRGFALALVVVAAIATPSLILAQGLRSRLTGDLHEQWNNQKTRGWSAALRASDAFRLTGVGRGAFEAPVAAFRSDDEGVRLVYAENFVVQRVTELGWPASLVMFVLAGAGVWQFRAGLAKLSPLFVAAASGVVGTVVHELTDFGTELPGVAVPMTAALGIVAGHAIHNGGVSGRPIPRWITLSVLLLFAGTIVSAKRLLPTLADGDFAEVAAAVRASPSTTRELVQEAHRRHPADGYFDLLSAERLLRAHDGNPLPALNRSMRRLPTEPKAHWMAARVLIAVKRPAQAALEYRAAIERRLAPPYEEMLRALGPAVVDAVPQTPEATEQLARQIISRGRGDLVEPILERYLTVSEEREAALNLAVQLALQVRRNDLVAPLVVRLLDSRPVMLESFVIATNAAATLDNQPLFERAHSAGMLGHPNSVRLLLDGVRLFLRFGDGTRARQLLRAFQNTAATLSERRERELLIAEIATREGALEEAVAARARARLLERQLRER